MSDALSTHHSFWTKKNRLTTRYPKLTGKAKTQVAVLGGGITGLSVALELQQLGYKVIVIEALTIGGGTTGGSTGHLDAHPEQGPHQFVKSVGVDAARLLTTARLNAIDRIEERSRQLRCDFKRVSAYEYSDSPIPNQPSQYGDPPPSIASREELQRDFEAAGKIGLLAEWEDSVPLPRAAYGYCISNMARFDCLSYIKQLADLFVQRGGVIYENSIASGPVESAPTQLDVEEGSIEFEQLVCAVHCNYSDVMRTYFQTPPYQSYVVAVRVANPPPDALFWDKTSPYYYTRHASSESPDLIIVGGCDKHTGAHDSAKVQAALLAYVRARYDVREVVRQWSAELFEPVDSLPIIGKLPAKRMCGSLLD